MRILNHRLCKDDGSPYDFVQNPNQGGAIGPLGWSYNILNLGNTKAEYFGMQFGIDPSADALWGWSCLEEVEKRCCNF